MKSHYFSSKLQFPFRNFSLHCDKLKLRGREQVEKGESLRRERFRPRSSRTWKLNLGWKLLANVSWVVEFVCEFSRHVSLIFNLISGSFSSNTHLNNLISRTCSKLSESFPWVFFSLSLLYSFFFTQHKRKTSFSEWKKSLSAIEPFFRLFFPTLKTSMNSEIGLWSAFIHNEIEPEQVKLCWYGEEGNRIEGKNERDPSRIFLNENAQQCSCLR